MDHMTHQSSSGSPDGDALCIREPEDLLSFIPHTMGEWPIESLVAISVGAGTVGVTVRVDLPPAELDDHDLEAYGEAICDHLQTDVLAEGVILAVYTSEQWKVVDSPPRGHEVRMLQAVLSDAGLPVLDAWFVGDHYWRSLLCDRTSCCPWPGKPLDLIAGSLLGAELVFRGSVYETSARFARELVEQEPAEGMGRSEPAVEALLAQLRDDPSAWWQPPVFVAALAAWDDALGSDRDPDPERLGLLAATLIRPAIRDAVMVAASIGGAAAWHGSVALGVLERRWHDDDLVPNPLNGPEDAVGVCNDNGPGPARRVGTSPGGEPHHFLNGSVPNLPGGLLPEDVVRWAADWLSVGAHTSATAEELARDVSRGARVEPLHEKQGSGQGSAAKEFSGVLLGSTVQAPDWARIARLERIARRLTELEDPEVRAPALALLAWICWVRGRGSKAAGHLRRVLSVNEGYRFAQLLARLIDSGHIAAWAKRPETAWRRLDDVA